MDRRGGVLVGCLDGAAHVGCSERVGVCRGGG